VFRTAINGAGKGQGDSAQGVKEKVGLSSWLVECEGRREQKRPPPALGGRTGWTPIKGKKVNCVLVVVQAGRRGEKDPKFLEQVGAPSTERGVKGELGNQRMTGGGKSKAGREASRKGKGQNTELTSWVGGQGGDLRQYTITSRKETGGPEKRVLRKTNVVRHIKRS